MILACSLNSGCDSARNSDDFSASEAVLAALDVGLGFSSDVKFESCVYVLEKSKAKWHPSDGGGRALITNVEDHAGAPLLPRADGLARIRLTYEAGPLGITSGGAV